VLQAAAEGRVGAGGMIASDAFQWHTVAHRGARSVWDTCRRRTGHCTGLGTTPYGAGACQESKDAVELRRDGGGAGLGPSDRGSRCNRAHIRHYVVVEHGRRGQGVDVEKVLQSGKSRADQAASGGEHQLVAGQVPFLTGALDGAYGTGRGVMGWFGQPQKFLRARKTWTLWKDVGKVE
jgi:hypothetical protein